MAQKKSWFQARAEYALASTLIALLRRLPLSLAYRLGGAAAAVLDMAVPKLRRVALLNLAFAFPEKTEQERSDIVNEVFRNIGRLLVALARFPDIHRDNVGELIGYEGLEHYLAAKQRGRGVLVATAHLGNWELSAFAHALMTEPMDVMVRPLDNPFIDALVETRRTLSGNHLIFKKDAARAVVKALRQNRAVGILIDQNTSPAEGVFIDFFGRRACAGSAFVKFAQHSGAAVIPGFALWSERERRYVLRFYPEVEITGDIQADTQRVHSVIEAVIRQHPEQWMWIHRRWKTRPPGDAPLY